MAGFHEAHEALTFVDEATAQRQIQRQTVHAATATTARLPHTMRSRPEPVALDLLYKSLSIRSDDIGPLVVMLWPFDRLPAKGWQDAYQWQHGRRVWSPEDQPQGPLLYPRGARLNVARDGWVPDLGSRTLSIAVLADTSEAPNTESGARALVAGVIVCDATAGRLRAAADSGEFRADTARRFRSEAGALERHAEQCADACSRSISWLSDFERSLDPVPPFAPITVPATIRVAIAATP